MIRILDENRSSNVEQSQPASLRNILTVLFKRKRIILTFFMTVVIVVTAGSFYMPNIYQAESKLLVEKEFDSDKALLFGMNLSQGFNSPDFINSEIEILTSYPIASRVMEKFNSQLITDEELLLSEEEKKVRYEQRIASFQKNIELENPKNTSILVIRYESKNPVLASDIINYFVNTYITYRSEISSESETYKFLEEQINLANEKLSGLEQRQASFKKKKDLGTPETQRIVLMNRMAEYEKSLTTVQTKRIGKEAKLDVFKKRLMKGESSIIPSTEVSDSPSRVAYIAKLRSDLLDMEIRKEQLLQNFTPQYKEVIDLEKQITANSLKIEKEIEQIIEMEETAIGALKAEEQSLIGQIDKIKNEIRNLAQKEYEYSQISRGIEDEREIYSMLRKQQEEARLSLAKLEKGVKINVISPAVVQTTPIKPKKILNIILAVFLGLFGGLGLAFFIEYFDHTINSPDDLEKYAGINALGSIPEVKIHVSSNGKGVQAWRIFQ
jgi:uncharacterized protein involved in exopolysaccharide biosynthesis